MEKMKISGAMLANAKKAEEELAREQAKQLEDALPPDHPLRAELERQKSMMGGDLSGLPPGHPLLRALEVVKRRYEERQAAQKAESGEAQPSGGPKRAKKVNPDAARREAQRREDEVTEQRRAAAGEVNRRIEMVVKGVKELAQFVNANEEILNTEPFSRVKMARLRRMLFATERGVSECKLARF